ncbi:hypothetical protein [Streptomyces sp. NPDC050988]|uniref:hypothetical protein n=1 Tax=Streptomyces sp. NPDC050988 TaxID=3365637 RepID=UPI0037AC03D1
MDGRASGSRRPTSPLDDGPLRARLRTAVHAPGTLMDLRWMFAQYGYGSVLPILMLPLWLAALLVDGVRCAGGRSALGTPEPRPARPPPDHPPGEP